MSKRLLKLSQPLQLLHIPIDPQFKYKQLLEQKYNIKKEDIDNIIKNIDDIEYKLKHMDRQDILKIYCQLKEQIDVLDIKYNIIQDTDREVIEITEPEKLRGLKFYKSTGTSRNPTIKDFWFPFKDKDIITGRYTKLEDEYLSAIETVKNANTLIDEKVDKTIRKMLENLPTLLEYARFINYENAIISGRLFINDIRKLPPDASKDLIKILCQQA